MLPHVICFVIICQPSSLDVTAIIAIVIYAAFRSFVVAFVYTPISPFQSFAFHAITFSPPTLPLIDFVCLLSPDISPCHAAD